MAAESKNQNKTKSRQSKVRQWRKRAHQKRAAMAAKNRSSMATKSTEGDRRRQQAKTRIQDFLGEAMAEESSPDSGSDGSQEAISGKVMAADSKQPKSSIIYVRQWRLRASQARRWRLRLGLAMVAESRQGHGNESYGG